MDLARYKHSRRISCYYLLLLNVIIIPLFLSYLPCLLLHKAHIPRHLACSPQNLPSAWKLPYFGLWKYKSSVIFNSPCPPQSYSIPWPSLNPLPEQWETSQEKHLLMASSLEQEQNTTSKSGGHNKDKRFSMSPAAVGLKIDLSDASLLLNPGQVT